MSEETLCDIGERRLLREVVAPFVVDSGDDCAVVGRCDGHILVTTDPVPEPAAALLGGDEDPYWKGWLLVTINASDLAAGGAVPLAFVAAVEAPPSLPVAQFRRFLEGIRDSCSRHGLRYVGGNVREGQKLTGTGTAVGICQGWEALGRAGARSGDLLVSVGRGGLFWRDGIRARDRRILPDDPMRSPLFAPVAQLGVMWRLAKSGLIRAAMDNSDGLLPTLEEIALASGIGVELNLAALTVPESESVVADPARLWLGWGDWNVVACIASGDYEQAKAQASRCGSEMVVIGRCCDGWSGVALRRGDEPPSSAPRLDSERFVRDSWFRAGLPSYIETLLTIPLPDGLR